MLFFLSLCALCTVLVAQAPQNFRYQTVVRNAAGEILQEQPIGIRVSILQYSPTGSYVFSETYNVFTNSLGLINLSIGTGSTVYGSIESIDWGNGPYFLRIDVDPEGGNNFEFLGLSQLLSVPYALYAETAGNVPSEVSEYWQKSGNDVYYDEGHVGIGTPSPESILSVVGNENDWPGRHLVTVRNLSTGPKSLADLQVLSGPGDTFTSLRHVSTTYQANAYPIDVAGYGILHSSGNGVIICATKNDWSPGVIKFVNGAKQDTEWIESMRIAENTYVGIGTKDPGAKLEIADGDVFISDINHGIIMTSPDGQCWRGTLDNTGMLNFSHITCP